jgi:hypothetical protein
MPETAARLHQPVFVHPQIPSNQLRDDAYRGLYPLIDPGLATFGTDYSCHRPAWRRSGNSPTPSRPSDRLKIASGNAQALFRLA